MNPHTSPNGFRNPLDAIRTAVISAQYLEAPILFIKNMKQLN
jgi:hypothetical protein